MTILSCLLGALAAASSLYLAMAAARVAAFRRRPPDSAAPAGPAPPGVTVLKPVCGLEPGLGENLRSFCVQDYPAYQVVFGVRREDDPAIPVIRELMAEMPDRDLRLVVKDEVVGKNLKASNLHNMLPLAVHDILAVADSDMRVGPDYAAAIAAPFAAPEVGALTCLYTGSPTGGRSATLASRLGAMYLNEWFLPSVLVALTFDGPGFCFGSTMAVRRQVLERIGSFKTLAGYLADDYMLGHLVRSLGLKVHLSSYVVRNMVDEPSLAELFSHELRWARTILASRPVGYAFSFIGNNSLSLAALFVLASGASTASLFIMLLTICLRIVLQYQVRPLARDPSAFSLGLLPLRDLLCLAVWGSSFLGRRVIWRNGLLRVRPDGRLESKE